MLEWHVLLVNQTQYAVSMYCNRAPIFSLEQRLGIMEEGFCSWAYCCKSCENDMYIHLISCSSLHVPPQLKSVFSCLPATLCPRIFKWRDFYSFYAIGHCRDTGHLQTVSPEHIANAAASSPHVTLKAGFFGKGLFSSSWDFCKNFCSNKPKSKSPPLPCLACGQKQNYGCRLCSMHVETDLLTISLGVNKIISNFKNHSLNFLKKKVQ